MTDVGTAVPKPRQGLGSPDDALRGNLGVPSLLFSVIAFNGPTIVLLGLIGVVVSAGNGLAAPLTYLIVGALILIFSIGLNAMAGRMKQPGAFYTYIAKGIGRPLGLSAGFLAIVSYAALGSSTFAYFAIGVQNLGTKFLGNEIAPWWVIAIIGWALVTILSLLNIEISAKVLGVFAIIELILVFTWNAAVNINGGPETRTFEALPELLSGSPATALVFGALCLTGFESLQVFRSETRDPARMVPRATYISVIVLALMYSLSAYSYIIGYGPSNAVSVGQDDPTAAMLGSITTYLNASFADLANVLFVTATFAACLAIQNILARYVFALARDKVLPSNLGKANVKQGSPMRAAALVGFFVLLVFVVPAVSGFGPVQTYLVLSGIGAYILIVLWFLTSVAIIVYFARNRAGASLWKSTIAPVIACIGLGAVVLFATVSFDSIAGLPTPVAILVQALLAVLVIGGIVYGIWLRGSRTKVYESIGGEE